MKNFLDKPDTNPTVSVRLVLTTIIDNGAPDVKISVNQQTMIYKKLKQQIDHQFEIPLLDPINISIEMSGKQYDEHRETAVILESVKIENFEIIPNWTNLSSYINERGINEPVSYLGYNGVWTLRIDEPFYRWHHRVTGKGWLLEPAGLR